MIDSPCFPTKSIALLMHSLFASVANNYHKWNQLHGDIGIYGIHHVCRSKTYDQIHSRIHMFAKYHVVP